VLRCVCSSSMDYEFYAAVVFNYIEGIAAKLTLLSESAELDLHAVKEAAQELIRAGEGVNYKCAAVLSAGASSPDFRSLNRALVDAEKSLLLADGLPGRPWYKHAVFAPSLYDGYEASVLPYGCMRQKISQQIAVCRIARNEAPRKSQLG
jgi:hypothetical protein